MIPQTVTVTELRRNLPTYLARVEAGESFLIPMRGKVVARIQSELDPAEEAFRRYLATGVKAGLVM